MSHVPVTSVGLVLLDKAWAVCTAQRHDSGSAALRTAAMPAETQKPLKAGCHCLVNQSQLYLSSQGQTQNQNVVMSKHISAAKASRHGPNKAELLCTGPGRVAACGILQRQSCSATINSNLSSKKQHCSGCDADAQQTAQRMSLTQHEVMQCFTSLATSMARRAYWLAAVSIQMCDRLSGGFDNKALLCLHPW